ncbi:hypothetical protein DFJ74DRAFT_660585 [Hyaloraphidium curvatum]|nr:hypothetical protein DFJ74DRAFT_660585 [Hyaloraphidium curvatum]
MPPAAAGPGSRTSARGPLQRAELSGLDVTDMFRDALPRGSTHSASRQRSSLADRFSVRRQSIPASPEPPANPLEKEPSAPTADELFGGDAPAPSFRGAPRSEPGAKLAEREIAAGLSKLDDLEAKFREQTARIGTRSAPTTPAKPAPRAPATPARAAPPAVPAPAPRSAPPPQRTRMSGFSLPSVASKEEIEDAIQRLEELEVVIKGRSSATRRPERGDRSLLSEVETATKRLDELEQVFWNEVVGGEFALPGAREAEAPRTPRSSLGAGGRAPRTPEIVVDDADAGNDSGFVGGATPSPSRFGSAAPSPRRTLLPERGAPGSPAGLGLLPKPRPGAPPAPARDTASPSYPGSSNEALAGSAASVSVAVSPSEQDPLSSIVETARALNPLVASSTQLAYSAASSPAARTADDGTSEVLLALAKVGESVQVGLAAIQRYARAEASLKAGNAPATARSTPSATPPRSFADYEVPSPRPSAGSTRDVFRFRHHHDGVPCYGGRSCEWNRE